MFETNEKPQGKKPSIFDKIKVKLIKLINRIY